MTISFPSTLSPAKQQFLTDFYTVSDEPQSVDKYLSFLTDDVDFIMGLNAVHGATAVRKIRETMWGGVVSRHHQPERVYSFDQDGSELMLHGTVDYGLKNGKRVDQVGWAARVVFAEGDELKMKRYQVWLVSRFAGRSPSGADSL
ncbi:hypothetical protein BCR35DRAFT_304965 [Leucosporidium creatinivorum]|uniref:SnoaL-like domain-containing protein n=1 Tax=Leucosporidium creatinivorum TaxID=106004 RepID=A0A1Y2F4T1_9BASI|nr:hypothetical protein BCR35DRAFT_304965 [Leucosporidium creatinivorum]